MGTLKSSLVNPSLVDNDMSRLELRKERNRNEKLLTEIAEKLQLWKRFRGTAAGQTLIEIADPEIKYFEDLLSKSVVQLTHYGSVEVIESMRSEWRGALGVWKSIKYNMIEHERKLEELKNMIKEEEEIQKSNKVKKLEKYS